MSRRSETPALDAVEAVLHEWQAALDYASSQRIDPDPMLAHHVEQIRMALGRGESDDVE